MRVASQSTSAPRFSATVKAPKAAPAPTPAPKRLSNAVNTLAAGIVTLSTIFAGPAQARYEGVNRPDLLPSEPNVVVIDVAGFLTEGEEKRLRSEIESLEADTGIKLRLLAQNYPETPGLAVKDYWNVDANTVVFVADPTFANIVNVNVGQGLDLSVPRNFWSRLAGKYGVKSYVKENGLENAIFETVSAIDTCLREPEGRDKCRTVQGKFGEEASPGKFSAMFGQK